MDVSTTFSSKNHLNTGIASTENKKASAGRLASLLDKIINKTDDYLATKSKTERKKIGQFFTSKETAVFMASLFDIPLRASISICDPGAGIGILSAALIERLVNESNVEEINLVCYENDAETAQILEENLSLISKQIAINFKYEIVISNYITSQNANFNKIRCSDHICREFDLIIGNPPYQKVSKDAQEALQMKEVCYGAPNLYFLFASMSILNLKNNGEMVYIIPRSWTSGAYFKSFRRFLLDSCCIKQMHLFISRDKVFDKEEVLQETMIIRLKKDSSIKMDSILITTSHNNHDFKNLTKLIVPYSLVVSEKEMYVYLITRESEIKVLEKVHKYSQTLPEIGLKMKTGLTVDFRNKEYLFEHPGDSLVPLFYSQNMKSGRIVFPNNEKILQYVTTDKMGLIQINQNYLFVKRFTAKEEKRRLQCAMYIAEDFSEYNYISTQNKINFITTIDGSTMSRELLAGLYVLFNSSLYDSYYRILNGSTQVNSTEINNIAVPERELIEKLGLCLLSGDLTTTEKCNEIMEMFYGKD
ncbi:Eco57I restriction-modification methylase domain-containing protein [Acetobacterium malicum]|uniref:Eco57I restriction-modification methylase domain-containing protein n=1 Tax=Acetobacterium malicum TaxID=52692 RepID=UPI001FACAA82|nr:Eco57I restriction-modification methylase domain-containing protein [Acetobacterium malicum]